MRRSFQETLTKTRWNLWMSICKYLAIITSHRHKTQYLHKILRGDAKSFYLDRVDGYATMYQRAVNMINNEEKFPLRRTRVNNYLTSLRLSSLENNGIETSASPSQIYRIIIKFSRKALKSYQGDFHKVEFFRNAVFDYPWSHEPLKRVSTQYYLPNAVQRARSSS